MRFASKVYFITGGGRGIGRAIAKRLADEGARVCIADSDAHAGADAADEYGDRVRFERCNVAKETDVRRAITAAVKWGGRLDGLVNNAGIADPVIGPVEDLALAVWDKFLATNLTGAFLCTKHAIRHMRAHGGSIVNIGSTRAEQSEPETIAYSASKGGIAALTHSLAISLGPAIRVNCIEPGWIATSTFAPRDARKPPKLTKRDHEQHPAGRVGMPEDIASLCAWLLSSEAGFVTGSVYISDGGMTRKMIYA
jgi:NAD(P)-dependent dehydrogenase (short-subunit alcohol dehydrogenase family)